jgi:hypothetical protein
MAWMPPPDGIAMCQGDGPQKTSQTGRGIHD